MGRKREKFYKGGMAVKGGKKPFSSGLPIGNPMDGRGVRKSEKGEGEGVERKKSGGKREMEDTLGRMQQESWRGLFHSLERQFHFFRETTRKGRFLG